MNRKENIQNTNSENPENFKKPENKKIFPTEALLAARFDGETFETRVTPRGAFAVFEKMTFSLELPLDTRAAFFNFSDSLEEIKSPEINDGELFTVKKIKRVEINSAQIPKDVTGDKTALLCRREDESTGENEAARDVSFLLGDTFFATFYDTRPPAAELFRAEEIFEICRDAALYKREKLGDSFLNPAERELADSFGEWDGERTAKVLENANEGRAAKRIFDSEKFEDVKRALNRKMENAGYSGAFPDYTKGEKYISFGVAYFHYFDSDSGSDSGSNSNLTYENNKYASDSEKKSAAKKESEEPREYFYDLAASFGKCGKRPASYRSVTGERRLPLPALSVGDEEREARLELYISALDMMLDGKKPPKEFISAVSEPRGVYSAYSSALAVFVFAFSLILMLYFAVRGEKAVGAAVVSVLLLLLGAMTLLSVARPKYLKKEKKEKREKRAKIKNKNGRLK